MAAFGLRCPNKSLRLYVSWSPRFDSYIGLDSYGPQFFVAIHSYSHTTLGVLPTLGVLHWLQSLLRIPPVATFLQPRCPQKAFTSKLLFHIQAVFLPVDHEDMAYPAMTITLAFKPQTQIAEITSHMPF